MEEVFNQSVGDLYQSFIATSTTFKIIAGLALWYLTGGILITRFWASDFLKYDSSLVPPPDSDSLGYCKLPFVWVFSPILGILCLCFFFALYCIGVPWKAFSYFLLSKSQRARVLALTKESKS